MIIVGLVRMSDGLRGMFGSSRSSSSYSSGYGGSSDGSLADDGWLPGKWTTSAGGGTYCQTWIRFNADHSLSDNAGTTGTWSIDGGSGVYSLAMTTPGTGRRVTAISHSGDSMTMGSGATSITWQRATSC
jgi:hypothetical protein